MVKQNLLSRLIDRFGTDFTKPDEKMSIQTKNLFTLEESI